MNQDALITVEIPGLGKSRLNEIAETHIAFLRDAGVLRPEHELGAALVLQLAAIAGATTKGYAAAQVFRELREAIAALPQIEPDPDNPDDLAGELEALGHDC
jgi:hypothetical protein